MSIGELMVLFFLVSLNLISVLSIEYDSCQSWDQTYQSLNHNDRLLPIPPRYMWGWGPNMPGYCGETSFQSIMLYYGSYVSTEWINRAAGSELLLESNAIKTAEHFNLNYAVWDTDNENVPQVSNFIDWMKVMLLNKVPVVAGVYADDGKDLD